MHPGRTAHEQSSPGRRSASPQSRPGAGAPQFDLPVLAEPPGPRSSGARSLGSAPGGGPASLPTEPPRAPTLTAQMRAVQPPDVARQSLAELSVLAREIAQLPDALRLSGLARMHQRAYLDLTQAYAGLARSAWEAVAEERLEQAGAEPGYRQHAISVARRVTTLQRESQMAAANTEFPLPKKLPALWGWRVRLVRRGLRDWQSHPGVPADPLLLGQRLQTLEGHLGLASAHVVEVVALRTLGSLASVLSIFVSLCFLLLAVAPLGRQGTLALAPLAAGVWVLLGTVLLWLLTSLGAIQVPQGVGALVMANANAENAALPQRPLGPWVIRGWLVGGTCVGLVAAVGVLALSVWALVTTAPPVTAATLSDWLVLSGVGGLMVLVPAWLIALATVALVALPLYLYALGGHVAALVGHVSWVPAARRLALRLALPQLGALSGALLVGTLAIATAAGAQQTRLATLPVVGAVTVRTVALLLALLLPYLLLVELPYRVGLRRWRRAWLRELATRRADLESHVRRLSVPDPTSGAQNTSEETLRAMQYDLVLLQFYRTKTEEARRTPAGPFGLVVVLAIVVLAALVAILADGTGQAALRALLGLPG